MPYSFPSLGFGYEKSTKKTSCPDDTDKMSAYLGIVQITRMLVMGKTTSSRTPLHY